MVLPIGQRPGEGLQTALRTRELWIELADAADIWLVQCGSVHLAHRDDEWAVLDEFAATAHDDGYQVQLLTAAEVRERTPAANPKGLRGGMSSETEVGINPRTAIARFAEWLNVQQGVAFRFHTAVADVETGRLATSMGDAVRAERIIICSGNDTQTLFPDILAHRGLRQCELQMMRTRPQPVDWTLGPHLASGLTLRHYRLFDDCPSFPSLQARIAEETPELDRYGIHVLVSQNNRGEVILGDSHEYDAAITGHDKPEIDELILREARKIIQLPDWTIEQRWHGQYVKHPSQSVIDFEPLPGVRIVTSFGGAGMTLALGWAEHNWK